MTPPVPMVPTPAPDGLGLIAFLGVTEVRLAILAVFLCGVVGGVQRAIQERR